jgi:hypothetical protein
MFVTERSTDEVHAARCDAAVYTSIRARTSKVAIRSAQKTKHDAARSASPYGSRTLSRIKAWLELFMRRSLERQIAHARRGWPWP